MTAEHVLKELKKYASLKKAKASAWFFKTGEGQYGHGDVFIGVTVPEQRTVARKFRELPLGEVAKLLHSEIHECRLTALLILVEQYQRADAEMKKKIVVFYLKHRKRVNNWDLVDSSASYILGDSLLSSDRATLYLLTHSRSVWDRRIAIIATHAFIKQEDFKDTLRIAKLLLNDTHDLIHKAVGWMLREVGNRSPQAMMRFIDAHHRAMPRTMLRYAIEKLSKTQREKYLKKSRS